MRNAISGFGKEVAAFFVLVFILIVGAIMLGEFSKLAPDNAAIQSLKGTYEFLARLFIDWGSPDPMLWIVRILVGVAAAFGVYLKSERSGW